MPRVKSQRPACRRRRPCAAAWVGPVLREVPNGNPWSPREIGSPRETGGANFTAAYLFPAYEKRNAAVSCAFLRGANKKGREDCPLSFATLSSSPKGGALRCGTCGAIRSRDHNSQFSILHSSRSLTPCSPSRPCCRRPATRPAARWNQRYRSRFRSRARA